MAIHELPLQTYLKKIKREAGANKGINLKITKELKPFENIIYQ